MWLGEDRTGCVARMQHTLWRFVFFFLAETLAGPCIGSSSLLHQPVSAKDESYSRLHRNLEQPLLLDDQQREQRWIGVVGRSRGVLVVCSLLFKTLRSISHQSVTESPRASFCLCSPRQGIMCAATLLFQSAFIPKMLLLLECIITIIPWRIFKTQVFSFY